MAITSAVCTSFKVELLKGVHDFTATTGNTFKIALYDSDATLGAGTTAFTTSEEITNTSGTAYTSGGASLTSVTPVASSTTALCDFDDVSFSSATFTANGALIYNSVSSSRRIKRYHKISIGGPLCRFNQDGVDSPGAKHIGMKMLYLQLVGVQKHGAIVVGDNLLTKQLH